MHFLSTFILAAAAFGLCGCSSDETSTGKKLSLLQPTSQTLKRGETNKIAITVTRRGFDGDVGIEFVDLPAGVKVVEEGRIPKDDNLRNFTLHADNDAALVANHHAKVKAKGPEGLETSQTFEITVKE
jgi:hypothetical protein